MKADLLSVALRQNDFSLEISQQQQLLNYLNLLIKWNKVYNLTAITEPKQMVYLHIIDSLLVAPYLQGHHCLDVGSGAGLPGIPLAIYQPHRMFYLLDKNIKKTRFMVQAVAELELRNVNIIHSRCEDFKSSLCFDSIVSRAYGSIKMFLSSTSHLVCARGRFIAMKGKFPKQELEELSDEFVIEKITALEVKGCKVERHLICLHKKEA